MARAQAALDFLMTYGWALLILSIAAAAIVSLGIFDTGSFVGSRAVGFSQMTPVGWSLDSNGVLLIKLKNNAGSDIEITSINASLDALNIFNDTVVPLKYGENTEVITVGQFSSPSPVGTSYSIRVNIVYIDVESGPGFEYHDAGTITGKVI
jgi:hypothetical protein